MVVHFWGVEGDMSWFMRVLMGFGCWSRVVVSNWSGLVVSNWSWLVVSNWGGLVVDNWRWCGNNLCDNWLHSLSNDWGEDLGDWSRCMRVLMSYWSWCGIVVSNWSWGMRVMMDWSLGYWYRDLNVSGLTVYDSIETAMLIGCVGNNALEAVGIDQFVGAGDNVSLAGLMLALDISCVIIMHGVGEFILGRGFMFGFVMVLGCSQGDSQ